MQLASKSITICANHLAVLGGGEYEVEADGRTVHVPPAVYAKLGTPYESI